MSSSQRDNKNMVASSDNKRKSPDDITESEQPKQRVR
jgi:hypothetical protein